MQILVRLELSSHIINQSLDLREALDGQRHLQKMMQKLLQCNFKSACYFFNRIQSSSAYKCLTFYLARNVPTVSEAWIRSSPHILECDTIILTCSCSLFKDPSQEWTSSNTPSYFTTGKDHVVAFSSHTHDPLIFRPNVRWVMPSFCSHTA